MLDIFTIIIFRYMTCEINVILCCIAQAHYPSSYINLPSQPLFLVFTATFLWCGTSRLSYSRSTNYSSEDI